MTGPSRLIEAVGGWLERLSAEQRAAAVLAFDGGGERHTWSYWPAERRGLALSAMAGDAQRAAFDVLAAMVSQAAFAQAVTIVGSEDVLRRLEADGLRGRRRVDGLTRDPLAYHLTVFGAPNGASPWGVRFEGHHVSVHATVVDGELVVAPAFLGANPASAGPSLRPLGQEEDAARVLLAAIPAALAGRVRLEGAAPDDVLTGNAPSVEPFDDSSGVALDDLPTSVRHLAADVAALHVARVPEAEAGRWWGRVEPTIGAMRFAWAGDAEPGAPHYFRFWHPRLLVEHDNTQNGADHAHNVVRDPAGDFGADLLRSHRAAHPH